MTYTVAAITSFVIAVLAAPLLIPVLHKLKFGQEIREEGPKWHSSKSGTPTMGGVIFILAVLISGVGFLKHSFEGVMLIYLSVAFGVIGFIDDYIKVAMKRNLGLTEVQKFLMQLAASVIFVGLLYHNGLIDTAVKIPFTTYEFEMGIWYLPLATIAIIGCVNAVNLTDGIDGLASSVSIIVFLFFAYVLKDAPSGVFSIISAAAVFGFLMFNKHPAKVFMGDTGSLFLGGALAGIAVCKGMVLHLVIAGGVYVIETVSVILQVASFKLTGKRIFKMSPIHHHFEMCGWSENKIVIIFTLAAMAFCALALIKTI